MNIPLCPSLASGPKCGCSGEQPCHPQVPAAWAARFQSSPSMKGIIISVQTLSQSLAAQLPPKHAGKQPKLPNLPKQQLRTVPVTQRKGEAGVRVLASCRLREGKPGEEMITSAVLVAITGM